MIFAESPEDIPVQELREGRALVLKEVPEENAYLDITEEMAGTS